MPAVAGAGVGASAFDPRQGAPLLAAHGKTSCTRPQGPVGNVADTKSAARGVPRCRTATGRTRGELRRPSISGDHSPVARVLESPPGSKPSVNSALTGARRRPLPIAQTPLLRQRASPAAARRLFPERCRQRAPFAGVRRVRLCGQVSRTSHLRSSRSRFGVAPFPRTVWSL